MTINSFTFNWDRGQIEITELGAMCAPAMFELDDGRKIDPFALAPWHNDRGADYEALPPLLKRLRGEWVCVPFGMPEPRADLPSAWVPTMSQANGLGSYFHGPSANNAWKVVAKGNGELSLAMDYPKPHPIARVVRSLRGHPGRARIDFSLEVIPRRSVSLPVGLHPVFRIPSTPQRAKLSIGGDLRVFTYPMDAETGVSTLAHGRMFDRLTNVIDSSGVIVDLTQHPLKQQTEEIVLVADTDGQVQLDNLEEHYRVNLTWDNAAFPSCNLWISNRGRTSYPWNGRFQALGIEPVAAPFDLGTDVATTASNPLKRAGVQCSVHFIAGEPWCTEYAIEVIPL